MDNFLKYYERELTFTREMAVEFARKYPKVASRLLLEPEKCEDPHMERLIEAFAFECARLHLKIDDDFPEIAEPLLNIVFPQFIRPMPSVSVVRFEPDTSTIPPSGYCVQKNTALYSKQIDRTDCKFATVYPVTLWPAEVASAGLREPRRLVKDAKQAIVIQLKTCNSLGLDQITWESIRIFINGTRRRAFQIYDLLCNNACYVEYVASNGHGKTDAVTIPVDHIRPVGFEPDEAMLPSLRKEFPGHSSFSNTSVFPRNSSLSIS